MKHFLLICVVACGGGGDGSNQSVVTGKVTPACTAVLDDAGDYTVTLNVNNATYAPVAGGSEYVFSCTVAQSPAQEPPGVLALTLSFSTDVPKATDFNLLDAALTSADFRIDYPGRVGVFSEIDISDKFAVKGLEQNILSASAAFRITKIKKFVGSTGDPGCTQPDIDGQCFIETNETHDVALSTMFPTD